MFVQRKRTGAGAMVPAQAGGSASWSGLCSRRPRTPRDRRRFSPLLGRLPPSCMLVSQEVNCCVTIAAGYGNGSTRTQWGSTLNRQML